MPRGISFDFSINIPTLLLVFTTFVSITAGWVHLSDTQTSMAEALLDNTKANQTMSRRMARLSSNLVIVNERMKAYPLHRHVDGVIIYDATPPGQISQELEEGEK